MMFKYDMPFHANSNYVQTLSETLGDRLYSVYFMLDSSFFSDARIHHEGVDFNKTIDLLSQLPTTTKKYLTINGRYTPLSNYSTDHFKTILILLERLRDTSNLTGILWLDFYFLQRLQQISPEFCKTIEAVPSINVFIDSFEKLNSQLMYVGDLNFLPPSKVIIDRTLNRRIDALKDFVKRTRKAYPEIMIESLVNEGCLYGCPFKVNHDIIISLINEETSPTTKQYVLKSVHKSDFNVAKLNEKYGCLNYINTHPNRFFEMPFIRPEDLHHYEGLIDVVKISGKVKSDDFVFNVLEAYEEQAYDGNLLDLLDAAGPLQEYYYVRNDEIPNNFHQMLTTCDKNCPKCKFCEITGKKVMQQMTSKKISAS